MRRGARDTQGNFFRKARPFAGRGAGQSSPPSSSSAASPLSPSSALPSGASAPAASSAWAARRAASAFAASASMSMSSSRYSARRLACSFSSSRACSSLIFRPAFVGAHGAARADHADADHHGGHGQIQPGKPCPGRKGNGKGRQAALQGHIRGRDGEDHR